MSSILKALKKLEEEKARQEQGKVDIATDILRSSGRQPSRNLGMPLLVAGLLLAGAAAGFYFSRPALILSEPAVSPAPPVAAQKPVPAASPPAPDPVPTPVTRADPTLAPQSPARVDSPPSQPLTAAIPTAAEPDLSREESIPAAVALKRPQLVLSGIVYQDDPQSRMAVINDLPVMSGTTIEGAEVVDILPDRVVFKFEGEQFSIPLSD